MLNYSVKCHEESPCFAKNRQGDFIFCRILSKGYEDKPCPFRKECREVTKGKRYPPRRLSWSEIRKKPRKEIGND